MVLYTWQDSAQISTTRMILVRVQRCGPSSLLSIKLIFRLPFKNHFIIKIWISPRIWRFQILILFYSQSCSLEVLTQILSLKLMNLTQGLKIFKSGKMLTTCRHLSAALCLMAMTLSTFLSPKNLLLWYTRSWSTDSKLQLAHYLTRMRYGIALLWQWNL